MMNSSMVVSQATRWARRMRCKAFLKNGWSKQKARGHRRQRRVARQFLRSEKWDRLDEVLSVAAVDSRDII